MWSFLLKILLVIFNKATVTGGLGRNLRNPARNRRAGAMRQFPAGQLDSMRTKVSLAFTVALLNITSSIFNRKLHIEKHPYRGEFTEIYWKYNILSLFLADRDSFFCVHWDQEGWRDDSAPHISLSKHIFQNIHNFVNKFLQFKHRSYSTAKRVVKIIFRFCVTKI